MHRGRLTLTVSALAMAFASALAAPAQAPRVLDRAAERWVHDTLRRMSVEEKVGQMIVSSFQSNFMSTDSEAFDGLVKAVHEQKVGGALERGQRFAPSRVLHVVGGRDELGTSLLRGFIRRLRLRRLATSRLGSGGGRERNEEQCSGGDDCEEDDATGVERSPPSLGSG